MEFVGEISPLEAFLFIGAVVYPILVVVRIINLVLLELGIFVDQLAWAAIVLFMFGVIAVGGPGFLGLAGASLVMVGIVIWVTTSLLNGMVIGVHLGRGSDWLAVTMLAAIFLPLLSEVILERFIVWTGIDELAAIIGKTDLEVLFRLFLYGIPVALMGINILSDYGDASGIMRQQSEADPELFSYVFVWPPLLLLVILTNEVIFGQLLGDIWVVGCKILVTLMGILATRGRERVGWLLALISAGTLVLVGTHILPKLSVIDSKEFLVRRVSIAAPEPAKKEDPNPGGQPNVPIVCVANPGPSFHSVFLRDRPWWSSPTDLGYMEKRGTELLVCGKIQNSDGLWYAVLAQDGTKRYVSADICDSDEDLSLISDLSSTDVLPPLPP